MDARSQAAANAANLYSNGAAQSSFTLQRPGIRHPLEARLLRKDEIGFNPRTKIKTVDLYDEGIIALEPPGVAGELHQISVPSAGCSTALIVLENDGRIIWQFPVLQTGSFKLGAAFQDGLLLHISASSDAPPRLTVNWRVV